MLQIYKIINHQLQYLARRDHQLYHTLARIRPLGIAFCLINSIYTTWTFYYYNYNYVF